MLFINHCDYFYFLHRMAVIAHYCTLIIFQKNHTRTLSVGTQIKHFGYYFMGFNSFLSSPKTLLIDVYFRTLELFFLQISSWWNSSLLCFLTGKAKTKEARQTIINPDWNFEKMGIGGLDKEFSDIFRRAFASRVFPPDIVEQMGEETPSIVTLFFPLYIFLPWQTASDLTPLVLHYPLPG